MLSPSHEVSRSGQGLCPLRRRRQRLRRFRREKFIEFGGPDGGDGGNGGDVIVECVANLNTLIDYRYQQHFKAKNGGHGMGQNRTRRQGRRRGAEGAARNADLR